MGQLMTRKPLVVNLFGGPGSGKSTMATRLFSELKELGYNAEYVPEYAKDLTWQKSMKVLDNQIYVFAKQYHRIWRLQEDVDVVITDSPLLLSLIYGTTSETFKKFVLEEFNKFDNINIHLKRVKKYNPKGRSQTLHEAQGVDILVADMLEKNNITVHAMVDGCKESAPGLVGMITTITNGNNRRED